VAFWEGDETNPKKSLHFFTAVYPKLSEDRMVKYCLLPWLSAQAAAVALRHSFTCVIHLIDGEDSEQVEVDIGHKEAAAYFRKVLAEYLDERVVEHLPLQAIETLIQKKLVAADEIEKRAIEEWLEDDAGGQNPRYRYYTEFVDLLTPPVRNNAREAAAARYGPLLDACYPPQPTGEEGEASCSAT
jgi:hypothetical protein